MENIINADYQVVQERTLPVIISEIKTIEAQVYKTAIDGAAEIGARLLEAKEQVGHGNWITWCEENLNYTPRQAQNFIKIHENYRDENSPYANTKMSSHLSISKALALLQVPEEEVKEFVEDHDLENMTVKKLEAEIKKWKQQTEKMKEETNIARVDKEIVETALQELKQRDEEKQAAIEEKEAMIEELNEKLQNLKKNPEESVRIMALEKQIQEEKESAKIAKEELEKEREAKEQAIQAAIAEKEEILRKEAEQAQAEIEESKQALEEKLTETQKKLALSNNADITAVKIKMDLIQKTFMEVDIAIENIGLEDKEQESKLRDATKQILQGLIDRL
ncbi:DUF3102 domain-containing protein [Ihubacter massiliensis]|uniref:DUF3102 domain-containing protein n=1 Tax=Ihubacter massiliensis TaxID=1852367 RepID=UPI0020975488|nr:DUF3102 domain-containing protein [Ihubacter massiliensis]MCO7120574.1 DUF3102 domain-containing protein [Ihubacter massiliensis]